MPKPTNRVTVDFQDLVDEIEGLRDDAHWRRMSFGAKVRYLIRYAIDHEETASDRHQLTLDDVGRLLDEKIPDVKQLNSLLHDDINLRLNVMQQALIDEMRKKGGNRNGGSGQAANTISAAANSAMLGHDFFPK